MWPNLTPYGRSKQHKTTKWGLNYLDKEYFPLQI